MSPIAGILEVVDQPLFDTLHVLAPRVGKPDRANMFVVPLGASIETNSGVRTKDFLETNMVCSGFLPPPLKHSVCTVRCAFIGRKILPVSSRFYADTLLRLSVNCKSYWTGPAWKCADPVTMVLNPDTLLAMGRHKRVDLVRALRQKFTTEIVIESQQPFSVEVTFSGESWREYSDDAPERLVVLLEGQTARAVM